MFLFDIHQNCLECGGIQSTSVSSKINSWLCFRVLQCLFTKLYCRACFSFVKITIFYDFFKLRNSVNDYVYSVKFHLQNSCIKLNVFGELPEVNIYLFLFIYYLFYVHFGFILWQVLETLVVSEKHQHNCQPISINTAVTYAHIQRIHNS